ncbi:glycosyltransferase family 9 protein [Dyadobacter sp. CY345]|uniref:glycosyltransferase family 9 protein n=1 Tax=Dyadobacter sp. CY345 TaxID=2909335 RepID=UPI001F23ABD1|nr:glycosyltransferase family 9 protein [Dyadobacter sp. CY345]MCF2446706.1 glycosyltransferase family 9 protein [Dyadobacter sp. CY345]
MKFLPETTRKIAIFRALQLGDMLCSVPSFRSLRAAYPDAEITLLGLPWAASFCGRFSMYIDRFIHFPGFPGLPEQPFYEVGWIEFVRKMRDENFDLVLQMQGNGTIVNTMLKDLHDGPVAGFHSQGNYENDDLFIEYPTVIPEISRHLKLIDHLGIPTLGTDLEFPIMNIEKEKLYAKHPFLFGGNYVCVHPGSRGSWRQWPPSHFALLADYCVGLGFKVIVTGTYEEAEITKAVIDLMEHPAIGLTGQTSLGEIGQLIKTANLLISNCTGVSHIASAVRTPSIVISMDGEPERWGPLNKDLHKTIDWTKVHDFENVLMLTQQLLGTPASQTVLSQNS